MNGGEGEQANARGVNDRAAGPRHTRHDALRPRRLAMCRWLLRIHRLQAAVLETRFSADTCKAILPSAYQEILLELYEAEHERRQVYQSCLRAGGPPGAAHRHAARLEALGAVHRVPDENDRRRQDVMLTEDMQAVLDHFMDAVEEMMHEFSVRPK